MPRMRSRAPAPIKDADASSWSLPILHGPRYSQSLERGLSILGCFTSERPVLGIADLADELEMSRSTTHRYVTTLLALGYLEQGKSRKYRLGLRVTDLGMSALSSTGLREHAQPYLHELRQRTGFTACLAVLDGDQALLIDRARSWRRVQRERDLGLHPGLRLPAYCTALGKALLAYLPEQARAEVLSRTKLTRRGPNAITSKQALRIELERIAEDGLAVDDQQLSANMIEIAAPVRDESREVVAAVGIAASPTAISLRDLVKQLSPDLLSTASRISSQLGYRLDDEL